MADTLVPCAPDRGRPPSDRHVRFVTGMVLDSADFEQEFAYHHERIARARARAARRRHDDRPRGVAGATTGRTAPPASTSRPAAR